MGNFAGHLLPGLMFTVYGLSWIFFWFWHHLKHTYTRSTTHHCSLGDTHDEVNDIINNSQQTIAVAHCSNRINSTRHCNNQTRTVTVVCDGSRSSFQQCPRPSQVHIPLPFSTKIPLEPLIKITLSSFGIISEAFFDPNGHGVHFFKLMSLYHSDGSLQAVSKLHHITMYTGFLVSGVADIAVMVVPTVTVANVSRIFFSMAFFIETVLLWYHSHGKEGIEIVVHSLLILIIMVSIVLSLLRIPYPDGFLVNSLLGVSILIQGTWFIQAGSILYLRSAIWGHDYDHDDATDVTSDNSTHPGSHGSSSSKQMMLAVVIFSWHMIGAMIFAGGLYMIMLVIFKRLKLPATRSTRRSQQGRRCRQTFKELSQTQDNNINDDDAVSTDHEETKLINA